MSPSTNRPVTYGPFALGVPCNCRIRAADKLRRHAASEQPAAAAKAVPLFNATWAEVKFGVDGGATRKFALGELSLIARLNSPAASGDTMFPCVAPAPADWPPNATLVGSPPKAAMLAFTQRIAAWLSRIP